MQPGTLANFIRKSADGELTDAQEREFRVYLAGHPDDRRAVQFEMDLRRAVGRVMGADKAPDSLRSELISAFAASTGIDSPPTGKTGDNTVGDAFAAAASSTPGVGLQGGLSVDEEPDRFRKERRSRSLPFTFGLSGLAAGVMLLVGSALALGIMGRPRWFTSIFSPSVKIEGAPSVTDAPENPPPAQPLSKQTVRDPSIVTEDSVRQINDVMHSVFGWTDVNVPSLVSFGYNLESATHARDNMDAAKAVRFNYLTTMGQALHVSIEQQDPTSLDLSATLKPGIAYMVDTVADDGVPTNHATSSQYVWVTPAGRVYRVTPATASSARQVALSLGMPDTSPQPIH